MEITGKVVKILDAQKFVSQKNGNEYVKNTFVLQTNGQYPKTIAFSVMGEDRFKQMNIAVGGQYNVSFDVESREWNGKYFTECSAWRAVRTDVQQAAAPAPTPVQAPLPENNGSGDGDDNLPF